LDRQLVLHVLVLLLGYGTYICILAVMPFYLARAPYSLSTGTIGAVYLPGAFAAIFASPCGGRLADLSSAANMQQPLRRMVYSNLLGVTLMPLCMLLIGWGLHRGLPLAVALVALFVASFVNSLYMPALFTVSERVVDVDGCTHHAALHLQHHQCTVRTIIARTTAYG
jgi:MFS family permease